jgi:photosystem II stability/assembly factor-like uncharacterized protein
VEGRIRRPIRRSALVATVLLVAVTAAGCASTPLSSPKRPASSTTTSTTMATTTSTTTTTTTESSAGFSPVSVTFVSADTGWVLGTVPAGSGVKLAVVHTTDGGVTWARSPAPDVTFENGARDLASIRFADSRNGWITAPVTTTSSGPLPSTLWSSHDGGASWQPVAVPGGGHVTALEASGGVFQLAELATTGTDGTAVYLYSSAATSDSWVRSGTSLPIGAGPAPSAQLTLQGGEGWAMEVDRTVGAGARLASGAWEPWTPPCTDANGSASVAASSTTDLVAVCDEGVWGPPPAGTTTGPWLFDSSDAGSDFAVVGAIPTTAAAGGAYSVATPPGEPQVVVVGGSGLVATFDGGHTWKTVYSASAGQVRVVGFTTATQGVAIVTGDTNISTLLMTRDAGATWNPVGLSGSATS